MRIRLALAAVTALVALAACRSGDETAPERGRRVYVANCIACHHTDPRLDGPMGPAVAGSSHELLEARVLRGEYPPGYEPKRDSGLMMPLPYLKDDIGALTAYLNSL